MCITWESLIKKKENRDLKHIVKKINVLKCTQLKWKMDARSEKYKMDALWEISSYFPSQFGSTKTTVAASGRLLNMLSKCSHIQ